MWWVCGLPKLAAFGIVNFDLFSNSESGLDLIFEKTRDLIWVVTSIKLKTGDLVITINLIIIDGMDQLIVYVVYKLNYFPRQIVYLPSILFYTSCLLDMLTFFISLFFCQ